MLSYDHESYLSPLTWRYGSEAMRRVWSEAEKRRLLRRFWVALAEAQAEVGLVTQEQVDDLRAHQDQIDIARATQIEAEIRHDLMAEIRTFAEQATVGGGIIHLGATSMDALDNVDALRLQRALDLIVGSLQALLVAVVERMESEADTPAMAFTHTQPAEPTTIGYRLAQYAQDLWEDWREVRRLRANVKGKGLKGAVGTSASYTELLAGSGWTARQLEDKVMAKLGLTAYEAATQTYPRKQDLTIVTAIANLGATLHKFAFDLRILQSPPIGEWSEPFGAKQVGSSAMPFKRNPIVAENINSLTRLVAALPRVAWDNAALSLLERTLDDSANRRLFLPEAFLLMDEALARCLALVKGMNFWPGPNERNLATYGIFAATERVLMEAVKAGGNRQELHEVIREYSMIAWAAVQAGKPNPLRELVLNDPRLMDAAAVDKVDDLLDATYHTGDAPERTRTLAALIRAEVGVKEFA
jgi:adenylosuccinate lyase